MSKELVSVIMPTYNRGYIIKRAIDSILSQTYENLELIIVDDFSTDNTENIINSYNDSRIIYIKLEKNMGANYARNVGFQNSNGKYITFQDSDDYSFTTRIEEQIKALKENKVDWVFTAFNKIDRNKRKKFPKNKIESDEIYNKLLFGNFVSTQVLLCKRKILEKISFDESLPRFQDWDLALRISKKYKGFHIDTVLLDMYIQDDSITRNPQKGSKALSIIFNKYNEDLNDSQRAKIICRIGIFKMLNREQAKEEFFISTKLDKSIKYKLIYILYRIKLLKFIYKIVKG